MTTPSPSDFKNRFLLNDPSALPELRAFLDARIQVKGGHIDWALLCEDLGLSSLASRELQLECRDNPDGPYAKYKMALLHREKGDVDKSLSILQQLFTSPIWLLDWVKTAVEIFIDEGSLLRASDLIDQAKVQGLPVSDLQKLISREKKNQDAEDPSLPDLSPLDSDCARFHSLFSGRENIFARQWAAKDGEAGYSPVEEPLTPAVIKNHLLGSITVGVYPIRIDGTCTFFALDLDISKATLEKAAGKPDIAKSLRGLIRSTVLTLASKFLDIGLVPLLEDSGYKGRHLWFFLDHPETAETLHKLGQLLLNWLNPLLPEGLHLEFFPKQASLKGKGLGNLIKIPLGIHRRTGRRALLLNLQGEVLKSPFVFLREVKKVSRASILQLFDFLKSLPVAFPKTNNPSIDTNNITPTLPLAKVAPLIPDWTENDFVLEPKINHLFASCPVLNSLKHKVDTQRTLSHDEQLVLIHTLGHLDAGPLAVNYLLKKCIDVGPEKLMGDKLKGSPSSCPTIRKRIPHITRFVACNCNFESTPERYPTPTLHLLSLPVIDPLMPKTDDLPALGVRYLESLNNFEKINKELSQIKSTLIHFIKRLPNPVLKIPTGTLSVLCINDTDDLVFTPDTALPS